MEAQDVPHWIALLQPIADDEWIIAHRGSEWLGLAPDLEEDLAFSSINQDKMGHAQYYYALLEELGEKTPEDMVYGRSKEQWRHAVVLETAHGDWARLVALRYFYEVFDALRLERLSTASWQPLQDGVRKIRREEAYHLQHFTTWFEMLATGTEESRHRLREAIADLWPLLGGLFLWGPSEHFLTAIGLDSLRGSELQRSWETHVAEKMRSMDLPWPGALSSPVLDGRLGEHSPDMHDLLQVMTEVRRSEPAAHW
ncbi:MAG: phenylacetate-CoA oxygenase subunit PaaI [Sulfobacillus thermosulfidooxidans]|nr:MAG: phenylacetate-CoA oxygenase subunit PaaI [Sulfobacillus thermosulfidooxidans]